MKKLYLIAGPNGAGKTTASFTILPEIFECKEFVNTDEIARGISPFNPETVAIQAGRVMLHRINFLLNNGVSFAIETTLATKNYIAFIKKAKQEGYEVVLMFLWLSSSDIAIERVKIRVREGGHNIPIKTVVRRYENGLKNLFMYYLEIVDRWILVDNSGKTFKFIAEGVTGKNTIKNKEVWNELIKLYNEE